jgi:hypothetical protein
MNIIGPVFEYKVLNKKEKLDFLGEKFLRI